MVENDSWAWTELRKPIDLTPNIIATALNSQAEDMIFISDPKFPDAQKHDSICVLLSIEKKSEETLLYFRKSTNDVMVIYIREKENPKNTIAVFSFQPLVKAESVQAPDGSNGVIFTAEDKGEVLVLENGFVKAHIEPQLPQTP